MSRRKGGRVERSPAKEAKRARRAASPPGRMAERRAAAAARRRRRDAEQAYREAIEKYRVAIVGAWAHEAHPDHLGTIVCESCGLAQVHVPWERYDVDVLPCLRGDFLGLPCAGETATTAEAWNEAMS